MRLDQLPPASLALVETIDWSALGAGGRRLRELGFDEGVRVELLHRAAFGGDPIAIRIGRMTIAMRRAQARAVMVCIQTMPDLAVAAE